MNDLTHKPVRRSTAWIWIAAVVLFVLHQDFWWWDSRALVFGFMPVGLFYHALYSIAAACLWTLAVRFAWPRHIEQWADADHEDGTSPS